VEYKNSDEVHLRSGRDHVVRTVIRCLRVTAVTPSSSLRHRHSDSADHAAKLYSRASGVFCSTDSEGIDKVRLGEGCGAGIGVCTNGQEVVLAMVEGSVRRGNSGRMGDHNRSVASVRVGFFYSSGSGLAWLLWYLS